MSNNVIFPKPLITATSMGASITSNAVRTLFQDNIGFQLVWTGTPTGSFDVQISMDHEEDSFGTVLTAGTWTSLTLSPTISAAGAADNAYIDLNQLSCPFVRVVYTRSSGTGTLNAYVTAKGI